VTAPGRQRVDVDELLTAVAARHGGEVVAGVAGLSLEGDRQLLERALAAFCEAARAAGASTVRFAAQQLPAHVAIHCEHDGTGRWRPCPTLAVALAVHDGSLRCTSLPRGLRRTLLLPQPVAAV